MSAVWADAENIHDQSDLLILLILADHANDKGECWPGLKIITKKSKVSRRTVERRLKSMAELGWIEVNHSLRKNGSQESNSYRLKRWAVTKTAHVEVGCHQGVSLGCHHVTALEPSSNHHLVDRTVLLRGSSIATKPPVLLPSNPHPNGYPVRPKREKQKRSRRRMFVKKPPAIESLSDGRWRNA